MLEEPLVVDMLPIFLTELIKLRIFCSGMICTSKSKVVGWDLEP